MNISEDDASPTIEKAIHSKIAFSWRAHPHAIDERPDLNPSKDRAFAAGLVNMEVARSLRQKH